MKAIKKEQLLLLLSLLLALFNIEIKNSSYYTNNS